MASLHGRSSLCLTSATEATAWCACPSPLAASVLLLGARCGHTCNTCQAMRAQNKVQQLKVLQTAGFRFWVDPEGFLVHQPHPPSGSFAEYGSGQPLRRRGTLRRDASWHNQSLHSVTEAW